MQLSKLVLWSVLPFAGCTDATSNSQDCQLHLESDLSISMPADPPLQFHVETCRLDVDACPDLCTMEMVRSSITGTETSCDVSFTGDTVSVKIHYDQYNPAANCAIAQPSSGSGF